MKHRFLLTVLLTLALVVPASAVIKVELPVSKRFDVAKMVLVGKVTKVNPDIRVVEIETVQSLKGDAPPQSFRLQIVNPPELVKSVAVGQPVVIFTKLGASVHIADLWLTATPLPDKTPPVWRATQIDKSASPSFPGTTASLVRVLQEMKTGKSTLLDAFEGKAFSAGAREIAKLNVSRPTFLLAADINGDGKPDLVVGTAQGVKLFLASADGFTDATEKWGLSGASGSCAAAGNVGGKAHLLVDKTLYLNDGSKFAASKMISIDGDARVIACSLGAVANGGNPGAALLLSDGRLCVFKADPGAAWTKEVDRKLHLSAAPLAATFGGFSDEGKASVIVAQEKALTRFDLQGDDAGSDFTRLTGDMLEKIKGFSAGLKGVSLTPIDVNGDHRTDLLVTADGASMMLVNRGFGTFLPDSDATSDYNAAGKGLPTPLSAIPARSGWVSVGGADDLLAMSDDGRVFQLSTSKAPR